MAESSFRFRCVPKGRGVGVVNGERQDLWFRTYADQRFNPQHSVEKGEERKRGRGETHGIDMGVCVWAHNYIKTH
jgi:hypothetical protein